MFTIQTRTNTAAYENISDFYVIFVHIMSLSCSNYHFCKGPINAIYEKNHCSMNGWDLIRWQATNQTNDDEVYFFINISKPDDAYLRQWAVIVGSCNGFSYARWQAITWTNTDLLTISPVAHKNTWPCFMWLVLFVFFIEIEKLSLKKLHNVLSAMCYMYLPCEFSCSQRC